jgi:DNA repair exonuclease SbcCD ATPase subunit
MSSVERESINSEHKDPWDTGGCLPSGQNICPVQSSARGLIGQNGSQGECSGNGPASGADTGSGTGSSTGSGSRLGTGRPGNVSSNGSIRIKRIRMVGFRSFEDYTLDIPSGLVFICGPNESGKTGIMKAIQLGLFTDAGTTRQDVRQLTRWGRDEGFRIELTLENQDGQWEIIRDFDTGRNILKKPDGTSDRDKHRISEIIAGLLGVPKEGAEAAYTASVCVLQDELASGRNDLKKLMENRVVGGGVDVMKLAGDAGKKMSDLKAGKRGGSRQGELTLARNRVSELEGKLIDVELEVKRGQEARTRALELCQQMEKLNRDIGILEEALDKAKRHASAMDTYDRESKELKRVYDQKHVREGLEKRLDEIEPEIQTLAETLDKLKEKNIRKHRLAEIERETASIAAEVERFSEISRKAQNLLKEAEDAEKKAKSLALTGPEKVNKAENLHRTLLHYKQVLAEDGKTLEQLKNELDTHTQAMEKKSARESWLSKLLGAKNLHERLSLVSSWIGKIEPAVEGYENSRRALAGLARVSEQDVREATRLSAEVAAMGKAPAGLNVEVSAIPGAAARGQLSVDDNLAIDIEPGISEFSALKRIEVKIPQIMDLKVNTADAQEFFARRKEAESKLNNILNCYGAKSSLALSEALDKYREAQSEVAGAHQNLGSLVAAIDDLEGHESPKDLCITAKKITASLGKEAGRLKLSVSDSLVELGMEQEELETRQISEIEKALQNIKRELQDEAQAIAKLNGSIDGLALEKKEQEVRSLETSIVVLAAEAGCTSVEDMVAKRNTLFDLNKAIQDRKSRAGDLLGDKSIDTLNRDIGILKQKLTALEEEERRILAKGVLPGDLEGQLRNTEQDLKSKQSERDQILGKLSAIDPEQLAEKETGILARLAPANKELQDTLAYKMLPEQIVEKELELDAKRALRDQLNKDKTMAEATAQVVTQGAEDIAGVTEELEEAKRHLAHIEREYQILEILRDTLPEARTRAVSGMFDLLSQASSKYIGHMTAGRYSRMDLSEDLSPLLYSESRGWPIDALQERSLLSTGTADQVLLAVRLAVADLMSQGKCPPVIMDDPFVHFDPARRQAGIEALKQISDVYQVIVFTCHDYPEIAGEQKVNLGGGFTGGCVR